MTLYIYIVSSKQFLLLIFNFPRFLSSHGFIKEEFSDLQLNFCIWLMWSEFSGIPNSFLFFWGPFREISCSGRNCWLSIRSKIFHFQVLSLSNQKSFQNQRITSETLPKTSSIQSKKATKIHSANSHQKAQNWKFKFRRWSTIIQVTIKC